MKKTNNDTSINRIILPRRRTTNHQAIFKISVLPYTLLSLGLVLLLSLIWITIGSAQNSVDSFFTIIALPDTQHYTDDPANYANFSAQTQWIVTNRIASNIEFVTHLGDIVEHGNNDGDPIEWQVADAAMSLLEDPVTTLLTDGIPFGLAVGNKDIGNGGTSRTELFNLFFGVSRFLGRGYYGGSYEPTLNDNNFELFSGGGYDFIIVHFDYDSTPDPAVLDWADNLLKTYSNRLAISVAHSTIGTGNPGSFSSQGQAIYDALKDNPNLFLMLGGHVAGEGQRVDTYNDNTVYSLLSDYQSRSNGGNGWLRIMEFSPANNEIRVKTYSPVLDQFETDANSQFTLSFPFSVVAGPDQTIILPANAILDGTVSDRSIPVPPGPVTATWSVVSVPQSGAVVNFTDPNMINTTASFSITGDYVLGLTASNGVLSAYDEVTITVTQLPPTVNAGPDQTINPPDNAVFLDGTVSDDGIPNPPGAMTTTWNKMSGPGPVTFTDANAVDTTATLSVPGKYVLRLTADDGWLTNYDEITVVLNQPPSVNAGPNQLITFPNSATLDGTVTDDGYPIPPGGVTNIWTQVSGPGTVTFANANAVDTTASFSMDGLYVLRLTANDSTLTTFGEVSITVNPQPPANQSPSVNAGLDQTITLPERALLQGTATDDGLPNPPGKVTTSWNKMSGPGPVTFTDASTVDTNARFIIAGDYVLRLVAIDGDLSAYDEVTITVNPTPENNVNVWLPVILSVTTYR